MLGLHQVQNSVLVNVKHFKQFLQIVIFVLQDAKLVLVHSADVLSQLPFPLHRFLHVRLLPRGSAGVRGADRHDCGPATRLTALAAAPRPASLPPVRHSHQSLKNNIN